MGQLNVIITRHIEEEHLRQIAAVSPEIKLWDASDLAEAERGGDFTAKEKYDAILAQADVLYGIAPPKDIFARAPKVKWVQSPITGVDRFLIPEIIESQLILTNSRGIHGPQASELVFTLMLMLAKQAQLLFRLQGEKSWHHFVPALLYSKTIGILGLGAIGKEIARLAKAFGMRVVASRRSTKQVTRARYVDKLLPKEKLPELLSESDFVVIAVPATSETDKLIGAKELQSMKSTAYLINIARGSIVDEDALVRALEEHWIAGAGLDAFATEPLPVDSKLWEFPNVIITSHIAGQREDYNILATELFCENLRRYLGGKKLLNVVDKRRGY